MRQKNLDLFFETSAKNDYNIENAFSEVSQILFNK